MITCQDVFLRPIGHSDTELILRWRNHPDVSRHFIYRAPFTPEGHTRWLETVVFPGKAAQFIICENQGGRPVGSVYLRDIDPEHRKAEFGIFIGEGDAQGKGYGTQAARGILAHGFAALGLHKVFLRVLGQNARAIRSYEKAGFAVEGVFRDDVFVDGAYHDVVFMAAFAPSGTAGGPVKEEAPC